LDLSGTLQGAGGVGGLLSDTKVTNSETSTFYSVGDANGNITEYVDVSGATAAHGEHTAFGETKLSGAMKDDFTHWFSSKPFDKETGFVVYQRRYYDIMLCRWISRDPFGIKGGLNEFGFVGNDGVNHCDKLGLKKLTLTYDMQSRNKVDFNEMLMMPINTVWATSMNKALKSIKKIVGKYDPKGNDCNCILKLTITGHSGVAGLINLGDGLIDPASIKNLAEVQQKYKNNPVYKEFLKKQNREKDFLISLSKLMCKEGAKIRFAQCQTEHPETRKFLERIFGEDVDVILYELDVKWQWGFPKEVEVEYCN
jgi:RHS repeat-associated protein